MEDKQKPASQDDQFERQAPTYYPEKQIIERRAPLHQSDVPKGTIKQRHIEYGANVIFHGLEADLPNGSGYVKAYFCDDTFKLFIWTGTAWKSAQLS